MKTFAFVLIIALFGFASSQWIDLQPVEYENDDAIQKSLNFGASYIVRKAINNGVIPEGEYKVVKVTKVEKQVTVNGTDDRFNLEINGPRDATLIGNVTVTIWATTGELEVTDYFYSYYFNRLDNGEGEAGEGEISEMGGEGEEEEVAGGENAEFVWDWFEFENTATEDILVDPTVDTGALLI